MFDDNREYAVKCYQMLDTIKEHNPAWKQRIGSICFADDEIYTPLQAADVAAWLSNSRLKAQMEPREHHRMTLVDIDALLARATQGIFVCQTKWFRAEDLQILDTQLQEDPEAAN
jgi:hypothetical protein